MLRTPINKDIGKIRNNDIWKLSYKEAAYSAVAIALGVAVFYLCYPYVPMIVAAWVTMIVVIPIGACGFIDFQGMSIIDVVKEVVFGVKILVYESESNIGEDIVAKKKKLRKGKRRLYGNYKLQKGR